MNKRGYSRYLARLEQDLEGSRVKAVSLALMHKVIICCALEPDKRKGVNLARGEFAITRNEMQRAIGAKSLTNLRSAEQFLVKTGHLSFRKSYERQHGTIVYKALIFTASGQSAKASTEN